MTLLTRQLPVDGWPGMPLGRHVEHDSRSRNFAVANWQIRRAITPIKWPRYSPIFDQGNVGACTGMALAGWLGSSPHCGDPSMFGINEAFWIYALGTYFDAFPGHYPEQDTGSSGVGVCKGARAAGMIKAWSTAFTTDELLQALMVGPVIIGSVWTERMFDPEPNGEVLPQGSVAGGHEYLCRGWDGTYLLCDNSWTRGWGPLDGLFKISLPSWEILRGQEADVTVPHV